MHDHPPVEQKPETLVVEASVKPFISLVWLAALLVIVGSGLAIVRRAKENGSSERSGVKKFRQRQGVTVEAKQSEEIANREQEPVFRSSRA